MVLESLFPARLVERRPEDMLILSLIISLVCIFVSNMVFPQYAGVILPLFITITMTPLIYNIFSIEEGLERKKAAKKIRLNFIQRHGEVVLLFTLFFIGNFLAIFFVSIISPESFVASTFSPQISAIETIAPSSNIVLVPPNLEIIMWNNLRVMLFSFLLSFLIGTGAIFILSWNASILAIYLGSLVRRGLYDQFLLRTVGIIPHAPIEIAAYFLAGIAGGVLSVGVIRERLKSKAFLLVLKDSLIMLALAVLAVVMGAFIEVYL